MAETPRDERRPRFWSRVGAALSTAWPWLAATAALGFAVALALWLHGRTTAPADALEDVRRAAREREIAAMIATFEDVASAVVLLEGGQAPGGASVTVQMRQGFTLGPETAAAIAGLVSSAAPGIEARDVVVVDARDPARTHRLAPDADVAHEGAALLRLRARVERALADKVRGFFAGMQIESVVVVSAGLDLDRVRERLLEIDPKGRGEVVVKDARSAGAAMPRPAGAAGAAAASPPAEPADLAGDAQPRGESRITEYAVSRLTQVIERSPRGLVDVSASIVVFDRLVQRDGRWAYDTSVKDNVEDYSALAARALGVPDERRRDRIEIKYLPSPCPEPPVVLAASGLPAVWGAIAATCAACFLLVLGVLRVRRTRRGAAEPPAVAPAPPAGADETLPPVERLRREAVRLVDDDIDRAAAVLGRWLAREV